MAIIIIHRLLKEKKELVNNFSSSSSFFSCWAQTPHRAAITKKKKKILLLKAVIDLKKKLHQKPLASRSFKLCDEPKPEEKKNKWRHLLNLRNLYFFLLEMSGIFRIFIINFSSELRKSERII